MEKSAEFLRAKNTFRGRDGAVYPLDYRCRYPLLAVAESLLDASGGRECLVIRWKFIMDPCFLQPFQTKALF